MNLQKNIPQQYTDNFTNKWWFFVILFGAQFVLFPIASKNFDFTQVGKIIGKTLSNSLMGNMKDYYIYFQIPTLLMFLLLITFKNKMRIVFTIYIFISYILFAFLQNIGLTEEYGVSIVTVNLVMFLVVGISWISDLFNKKNEYTFHNLNWKTSWLIIISIFCFWWPLNWKTLEFSPDLSLLIQNGSSLAFCAMTPIILTVMTLNLPHVNFTTYRITSLVGIIIGFYNMLNFFNPRTVNIAIMHLPLLLVSLYAVINAYKKPKTHYNKS